MTFNLTEFLFQKNLEEHPDAAALFFLDETRVIRTFTYAELYNEIRGMASFLQRQTSAGDRIVLRLKSEPRLAALFFGSVLCGRIPVPVSSMLTAEELDYLVTDSGAACMIYDPDLAKAITSADSISVDGIRYDTLLPLPHTQADDPAYLIYTSGTTGYPRGVLHAHRSVLGRIPMCEGWTGLGPGDRLLHAGELNWSYTLGVGLMDAFAAGATALLYTGDRHNPAIWPDLIERHQITIFAAVPGLYRRMLKYGHVRPWPHFRHGLTAGDALPASLLAEWQKNTGTALYEALGMTEISTYISTGPGMTVKPGSPGRPQKGRRIALLDPETGSPFYEYGDLQDERQKKDATMTAPGLLAIHRSDPGLMLRYWNTEQSPSFEVIDPPFYGEWFSGGDLARFDADGYLIYEGRSNDLMNAGGYRVSPAEVERVLHRHAGVADVAVVETPLDDGLSIITACVVRNDDVDAETLISYCHEHLADYKCPKRVVFVDALPRTAGGKLRRHDLLRLISEA